MRPPFVRVWALAALVLTMNAAKADAQWINYVFLSASPSTFTPGQDSIHLNVQADWDTNSDCQFFYGHHCHIVDFRLELFGSNGFYRNIWVPWPEDGWTNQSAFDTNPGSSSVTYEARLTVTYNTPWGWQWRNRSDWATVRPAQPPPPSSANFYEHIDYGGGSIASATDLSFVGWDFNDLISSVRVPAGKTVVLYEHADYGGQSLTLTGDASDLRWFAGPGPDGTWNDCVSSIRIF